MTISFWGQNDGLGRATLRHEQEALLKGMAWGVRSPGRVCVAAGDGGRPGSRGDRALSGASGVKSAPLPVFLAVDYGVATRHFRLPILEALRPRTTSAAGGTLAVWRGLSSCSRHLSATTARGGRKLPSPSATALPGQSPTSPPGPTPHAGHSPFQQIGPGYTASVSDRLVCGQYGQYEADDNI